MQRDAPEAVSLTQQHGSEHGFADPHRILQHGLEHRLQITGRRTDDFEDLRGRRLLLKRLAQFVEQPRVLDGDDGLGGKVLYERDLLVSERPNLFAIDANHADKSILFKHRHTERRSNTTEFDGSDNAWIPVGIRLHRCDVGYLNCLLCCNYPAGVAIRRWSERFFPTRLGKCWRHIMRRTKAKFSLFI